MRDLPFAHNEQWHWRWVQFPGNSATTLHRVASYSRLDKRWVEIYGVRTVCDRHIVRTGMPGILSRMGAPRCKVCCRRLGIPAGDGAPFNASPKIEEPRAVERESGRAR